MARYLGYAGRKTRAGALVQVIWAPLALEDLAAIRRYISRDNPLAARRMALKLRRAGDSLNEFPHRGRQSGRNIRELAVIYPYIIRYRVLRTHVEILRIKHGAQRQE